MRLPCCLLLAAAGGCTSAVVSRTDERAGQSIRALDLARLPATKGEVLAVFGAPEQVLHGRERDVFLYRLTQVDIDVLNLNVGLLTGVWLPLYASAEGLSVEDTLYVGFDAAGGVRDLALRRRTW